MRRSKHLSYEATDVGSWSFVSSNEPVKNGCEVRNCDDYSLLDFKSAVQSMKYFIYHFTSILHGLIRTNK